MLRKDLIQHLAFSLNISIPDARRAVDCTIDAIAGQLMAKQVVSLRGLGKIIPNKKGYTFTPTFHQPKEMDDVKS